MPTFKIFGLKQWCERKNCQLVIAQHVLIWELQSSKAFFFCEFATFAYIYIFHVVILHIEERRHWELANGSWTFKAPALTPFFCTWELVFKSLASNPIFCENGDQITISKSCLASLDAVWTSIHVCQASFRMLLAAGHSFSRRWTNKFPEGSPRLFKAGALRSVCLDQRLCWASKVDLSICSIGRRKRACQCQKLKILSPLARVVRFYQSCLAACRCFLLFLPFLVSSRSQWALPDLNRECQIAVGTARPWRFRVACVVYISHFSSSFFPLIFARTIAVWFLLTRCFQFPYMGIGHSKRPLWTQLGTQSARFEHWFFWFFWQSKRLLWTL